eukprot:1176417-Prorocentrum_minimum.AAC.1
MKYSLTATQKKTPKPPLLLLASARGFQPLSRPSGRPLDPLWTPSGPPLDPLWTHLHGVDGEHARLVHRLLPFGVDLALEPLEPPPAEDTNKAPRIRRGQYDFGV